MDLTPHVRVHIQELVLDGFAPGDRYRIGEVVERELARLLAERGLPTVLMAGGATPERDAGSVELGQAGGAETVGARVAGAVYEGLGR